MYLHGVLVETDLIIIMDRQTHTCHTDQLLARTCAKGLLCTLACTQFYSTIYYVTQKIRVLFFVLDTKLYTKFHSSVFHNLFIIGQLLLSKTSTVVTVVQADVGTTSSSWVGTKATVDIVIIFIVSAYVKTTNSHSTDALTR